MTPRRLIPGRRRGDQGVPAPKARSVTAPCVSFRDTPRLYPVSCGDYLSCGCVRNTSPRFIRQCVSIRSEPTDRTEVWPRPLNVLWTDPMARSQLASRRRSEPPGVVAHDHARAANQGRSAEGRRGWGAEKIGRLKLNGSLFGYSPLKPRPSSSRRCRSECTESSGCGVRSGCSIHSRRRLRPPGSRSFPPAPNASSRDWRSTGCVPSPTRWLTPDHHEAMWRRRAVGRGLRA